MHDSAVIDVCPDEEGIVVKTVEETIAQLPDEMFRRFNMKLDVPLELEPKVGKNWMEMQDMT